MRLIRWILGKLILIADALLPPKVSVHRSLEDQKRVDGETASLKLYQYRACPFCVKVRRAMKRLGLKIETRDALHDMTYRQELLQKGGKTKVPCLRISDASGDTWLYESSEIIAYLQARFDNHASVPFKAANA